MVNALRGPNIVRAWVLYTPWIMTRRALMDSETLYEELGTLADKLVAFRAQRGLSEVSII